MVEEEFDLKPFLEEKKQNLHNKLHNKNFALALLVVTKKLQRDGYITANEFALELPGTAYSYAYQLLSIFAGFGLLKLVQKSSKYTGFEGVKNADGKLLIEDYVAAARKTLNNSLKIEKPRKFHLKSKESEANG